MIRSKNSEYETACDFIVFFSGKWAFNGDSRWSINAGSPTKKPQSRVLNSGNVYEVCPKRYFEISWKISGRNLNIISPFLWYIADKLMFKSAEKGHSK